MQACPSRESALQLCVKSAWLLGRFEENIVRPYLDASTDKAS